MGMFVENNLLVILWIFHDEHYYDGETVITPDNKTYILRENSIYDNILDLMPHELTRELTFLCDTTTPLNLMDGKLLFVRTGTNTLFFRYEIENHVVADGTINQQGHKKRTMILSKVMTDYIQ